MINLSLVILFYNMESTRSFRYLLTAASGSNIYEVLNCPNIFDEFASLSNDYFLGKSIFLENLTARIWLPSFTESPFPDLLPEMSDGEKYKILMEIEEQYPYLGLQFYLKKGSEWQSTGIASRPGNKGRESLLPMLQPNLTPNLVKLLDSEESLGVKLVDYGFGLLKNTDTILIEGEYRIAIDLVRKTVASATTIQEPPTNFGNISISSNRTLIRPANTKRAYLYLQNTGINRVWINFNYQSSAVSSGLFLDGGGTLWVDSNSMPTTSEVWGISEVGKTSTVSGIEASYS
ncbi:MAG: hypothetical protein ACRCT1_13120 [Microcoleaceae cyanobacterium]